MTISKSQGQTLSTAGVYLQRPCTGGTPQVETSTPGLGLKKSHSPIPFKAHGQGPAVGHHGLRTLVYGWAKPIFQSTS
jgi:hypothetical protein